MLFCLPFFETWWSTMYMTICHRHQSHVYSLAFCSTSTHDPCGRGSGAFDPPSPSPFVAYHLVTLKVAVCSLSPGQVQSNLRPSFLDITGSGSDDSSRPCSLPNAGQWWGCFPPRGCIKVTLTPSISIFLSNFFRHLHPRIHLRCSLFTKDKALDINIILSTQR